MSRQTPAGIFFVAVLAVALPLRADAQQSVFVRALSDLTAAIEGTYGDEGAQVGPAIDRMSAALTDGIGKSKPLHQDCGARCVPPRRPAFSSGVCRWAGCRGTRPSQRRPCGVRGGQPPRASACRRSCASRPGAERGRKTSRSDRGVADGAGPVSERLNGVPPYPEDAVTAYYLFHEARSVETRAARRRPPRHLPLRTKAPAGSQTYARKGGRSVRHRLAPLLRCRCRPTRSAARRVQPGVPRPGTRRVRTGDCRISKAAAPTRSPPPPRQGPG